MEKTKIKIEYLDGDNVNYSDIADEEILFVETYGDYLCKIQLSGDYNKEYIIKTCAKYLQEKRFLVDRNYLIICFMFEYIIVDLNTDKIVQNVDPDIYGVFEIHKFKSGYFVYGEGANMFLDQDFQIIWKKWCGDIFVNALVENEIEIFDDYITVFDWYGIKHFYNEQGEFDAKDYPQFNMDKNYKGQEFKKKVI